MVQRRSRKVEKAFSGKVMDTFVVRLIFHGGHMFALEIRLLRVHLRMVSRLRRSAWAAAVLGSLGTPA